MFKRKKIISNFFLLALFSSSCIQIGSRGGIGVMYHGQVMLAPALTIKGNDPVTLSKHEFTCGKNNKETAYFLFLECCGID